MKRFEHLRVFQIQVEVVGYITIDDFTKIKSNQTFCVWHSISSFIQDFGQAQNTPAPDEHSCDFSGTVSHGKQPDKRALPGIIQMLMSSRCPLAQKHPGGPSLHRAHRQESGSLLASSGLGGFAVDTLTGGPNVSGRGRDRSSWSVRWRARKGRARAKLSIFSLHFWFCCLLHFRR